MDFKDYYEILGLERKATQDEIKRAYRKVARKYHPDVNQTPEADARFKEAGEAYEVLKDPEKRAAYDQLGANWQAGEQFRTPPEWQQDFAFSGGGYTGGDQADFSEFFETLFGHANRGGPQFSRAGADQLAKINVDLADVYSGATRTLTLRRQEVDHGGLVHMRNHDIAVHIPKGVSAGQHIRLKGQGQPAMGAGIAGDLLLEVAFNPHPVFRVEGRDVYLDLPITPWEAALGGKVKMPTPAGKVDITIPKNARSGQKLRLKGRGIPAAQPGNLIAILKIVNPPVNSTQAREFYEKMAKELSFDPRKKMEA
ncbi:DnaJ C-terminal domain-containing protein [Yoonia maritima]|uniref:DnaJ C-terminal domain-containing protein n=1 Tax=Yoonia maritima TaxID=1435347 RepID=UPI0037350414